jgi:hypothetical protein
VNCQALKANGEQCGAYAVKGKTLCAGHDPESQQKALQATQAAVEQRERGLGLPELVEPADAEAWIAAVGKLLATGQIKESLARELRMIGKDWAAVHQGRLAATEFETLRTRVAELEGDRQPWR